MDLEVERRCVSYRIREEGEAVFKGVMVRAKGGKAKLGKLVVETWQER